MRSLCTYPAPYAKKLKYTNTVKIHTLLDSEKVRIERCKTEHTLYIDEADLPDCYRRYYLIDQICFTKTIRTMGFSDSLKTQISRLV